MTNFIWIIAIAIFGIAEAITVNLVSIWFVIGAAAALITSILHFSFQVQVAYFVYISALCLIITRPLAKKYISGSFVRTNADRVIGTIVRVTETIDNAQNTGAVYADGKIWTARSSDGSVISAEEKVSVERIEGVKLYVKHLDENNNQ